MSQSPDEGRRAFLKLVGGACGTAAVAAVGVPVVATITAPTFQETVVGASGFVPTVPLEAVPPDGKPVSVAIVVDRPKDAWNLMPPTEVGRVFLMRSGEKLLALSTICPHLGCQVDADNDKGIFRCPCHDTDFALSGAVTRGPSPRGLDELEARVTGGMVEIRYQRFKIATKDKVPA